MHEYYTPKTIIFQAKLLKITIFVDYASFYVNAIMLTFTTRYKIIFIFFDYFSIYRVQDFWRKLNLVFAAFPSFLTQVGKFYLPT